MLLLSALVLALIMTTLRGGDLAELRRRRWRAPVLPLLAVAVQVIAFLPDENASAVTRSMSAALHSLSYLPALAFVWMNRDVPWIWLTGCGLVANGLVILANGGYMPALPGALGGAPGDGASMYLHNNTMALDAGSRFLLLADILEVPAWLPLRKAFSIGDVMISCGAFALVQRLTRPAPAVVAVVEQ